VTRDLSNQSRIGDDSPAGVQYTGKHGIVLVAGEDGMVPFTREQAGAA
jgi:hypothetical protein